jgi:hypothetical protein
MNDELEPPVVTASRGSWKRPLSIASGVLVLALVSVAAVAVHYAGHLERVVAHPRLQRVLAEKHVGVTLASGRLGFGGLELRGLEVRITKARKNAPVTTLVLPLLQIDYALGRLVFSSQKTLGSVRVEGLAVEAMRYVRDDDDPAKGTDDEDDDDEAQEPPAVAQALVAVGRAPVSVGTFEVSGVTVTSEQRSLTTGKITRTTVTPLAARASLRDGTFVLQVGESTSPLRTTVTRTIDDRDPRRASFSTSFELAVRPGGVVESSLAVDLEAQDFEPRAPAKSKLLSAKLHAVANEAAGEVHADTIAVALADGLVEIDADAVHRDTAQGSVSFVPAASLRAHAARVPELLASSVASRVVMSEATPLVFEAKNLRFGPGVSLGTDSVVALRGGVRALDVRMGDEPLLLRGLDASGGLAFSEAGVPSGHLALSLDRLEAPGHVRAVKGTLSLAAKPEAVAAGAGKAKGLPPIDLVGRFALESAGNGADTLTGLDAEVTGRLVGAQIERPSLQATVKAAARPALRVEGVRLEATGPAKVAWGTKEPFETTSVTTLRIASLAASGAKVETLDVRLASEGTSVATKVALSGHAASLEVAGVEGKTARSPIAFSLEPASAIDLVAAKPSIPRVHGHAEALGATIDVDATPRGSGADVKLTVDVPSLTPLAAFVPARGTTLCPKSLARAGVHVAAQGFASALDLPAGEVSLANLELCNAPVGAKLQTVQLRWPTTRPASALALDGALAGVELAGDGTTRSATFALRGARRGPHSGSVALDVVGRALPDLHVAGDASFVARERRLAFSLEARAAKLDQLPAPLRNAGGQGLDALANVTFSAKGNTLGIIDRWDDAGLALAPAAFTNSTGQAELRGSIEGLCLHGDKGARLGIDRLALDGSFAKTGRALAVRATLSGDGLDAESVAGGGHLAGLDAALDVSSPDGEKIEAHARVTVADALARGKQRVSLGKVVFAVDAQGSRSEAIGITRLEASSSGLGTSFEASGSVDLRPRTAPVGVGDVVVVGRESAYLRGVLTADLAALTASVEGVGAKGQVRAPLVIAAGDRSLVRVDGTVELRNVSVDWGAGRVEGVDGRVPVDEEIRIDGDRIRLVPIAANAFSRERFEDQQPLVAGASFVRVKQLAVGEQTFGPLGASVRVERNTLALERLELAAFGGSVGGRLFVDLRGLDTRIDFRGDVTGLAVAADKKPLDAHVAVRLKPWRRALDGRVDVARTSPDQMRLMLDVYDPYQENVSANRARQALVLGYPKAMRMRFQDGFASVAIDLGGLGAAVRIDEIRGVPIAPMLEKSLLPKLPKEPPRL